jgi:preprotein translocase subunit SecD
MPPGSSPIPCPASTSFRSISPPASQHDLATFTAAHVGKMVDVTIDGKIITSPVIQTVITGPSLMLSGNFSNAELQSLAASLTAQSAIVEVKPAKHKR